MSLKLQIQTALKRAYEKAGTQQELERQTGVAQGVITRLLSGKRDIEEMRVSTLHKLFPELRITFNKDDLSTPESPPVNAEDGILRDPNLTNTQKRELIIRLKEMELDRKLGTVADLKDNDGNTPGRGSGMASAS